MTSLVTNSPQSFDAISLMLIGNHGMLIKCNLRNQITNQISSPYNFVIDPDLGLYSGRQYVPLDKTLFDLFSDSCPNRWGRLLMKRREAILAKQENRKPAKLSEI